MEYRYYTGEVVKKGDLVRMPTNETWILEGYVQELLEAGSEDAKSFGLPQGGILLCFDHGGLFAFDSVENEEDLEFIGRGAVGEVDVE